MGLIPNRTNYEIPPDKNILAALSSKKIGECSLKEIEAVIIPAVSEAFFYTGKRETSSLSGDLEFIYDHLPAELISGLPIMRIGEIPIAFKRGLLKEFGDYFGLNVIEFVRFCHAHYDSELRNNSVRATLKPVIIADNVPSIEQQFYLFKNLSIDSFEKNNEGKIWESSSSTIYNFLNKIGLIIFSPMEKRTIMKDAAARIIGDENLLLFKIVENFHRKPHLAVIESMEKFIKEDLKPAGDYYISLVNKSKFMTLKAFFIDIIDNEFNLNDLIDNKKTTFIESK